VTTTAAATATATATRRHEHRASVADVAWNLARRSVQNVFRVPGAFIPTMVMPLFFLISFSGSFSGLARGGIVPTDNMLNWVLPYAIIQGAAFAGMSSTFAVARDLEGGFYDRLLLAPAPRRTLLLGPMLAAAMRALIPVVVVLTIGIVFGARPTGGVAGLVTLLIAVEGIAAVACLWGGGVALRLKTQRAMALVQVGIFTAMFLSSAQVPVRNLTSWLKPVARFNPMTNILRLGREGFLDGAEGVSWHNTWGGLVALAISGAALALFAIRGVQKLDNQ